MLWTYSMNSSLSRDLRPHLLEVFVLRHLVAGRLGHDQRRPADFVGLGEGGVLLVLEVDVVELDLALLDLLGEPALDRLFGVAAHLAGTSGSAGCDGSTSPRRDRPARQLGLRLRFSKHWSWRQKHRFRSRSVVFAVVSAARAAAKQLPQRWRQHSSNNDRDNTFHDSISLGSRRSTTFCTPLVPLPLGTGCITGSAHRGTSASSGGSDAGDSTFGPGSADLVSAGRSADFAAKVGSQRPDVSGRQRQDLIKPLRLRLVDYAVLQGRPARPPRC